MIRMYVKLAIKVLGRSPFFTGVSLFGISFTLAVLMLMIAYLQSQFGSRAPMGNADRLVFMQQLEQRALKKDTIWQVDSSLVAGVWVTDSTPDVQERSNWTSISGFSLDFLENYFSEARLTTAEKVSLIQTWGSYDLFHNNKKIQLSAVHVDGRYFEIFDFELLEGRLLNAADVEARAMHVVLTDEMAEQYFGVRTGVVGRTIEIDNSTFEVKGLVRKARVNNDYVNADAFIPLSYLSRDREKNGHFGPFAAVALSRTSDTQATLDEISSVTSTIPFLDPSQNNGAEFNFMKVHAQNHFQYNALAFFYSQDPQESARWFLIAITALITLFCGVPLLNLVNLNVSRVVDRSAEIGVRKAYGANASNILWQFIFENIILTLIGGSIGLLLTFMLMYWANKYRWLGEVALWPDLQFFAISLLVAIVFGILSGYVPARRIARSPIAQSLKNA